MKIQGMVMTNTMRKYRKNLSMMLALLLLASSFSVKGGTSFATSPSITSATAADGIFEYVISGLHSFGDSSSGGIFHGPEFTFTFHLPENANVSGRGHVMLQAKGVDHGCNVFEINGKQVNVLVDRNNSSELRTEFNDIPTGVLHGGDNKLRIRALDANCGQSSPLDNFAVTNIVVFYQPQ